MNTIGVIVVHAIGEILNTTLANYFFILIVNYENFQITIMLYEENNIHFYAPLLTEAYYLMLLTTTKCKKKCENLLQESYPLLCKFMTSLLQQVSQMLDIKHNLPGTPSYDSYVFIEKLEILKTLLKS